MLVRVLRGAAFAVVCICCCVQGNEKASHEKENEELPIYRISGLDFENTKVHKVCLLAQFNATIKITHGENTYFIRIPHDANTNGSYCDVNYRSELSLKFDKNALIMTFLRNTPRMKLPEASSYCDHCDYGTWNMSRLSVTVDVEEKYKIHASLIAGNLNRYAKDLSDGIDVKRAYKCMKEDLSNTTIRLDDVAILNAHDVSQSDPHSWSVEIQFAFIQVQPFLVFHHEFQDPYMCKDITGSLMLVIMLPLIYFFFFILFYRMKSGYGCFPNCKDTGKKKHLPSEDTESCLAREESMTMPSGYSGFRLAQEISSDAPYF